MLFRSVFIPLESLHTQNDSITYVFKKEGIAILKQEVIVGETNSNEAVITAGLLPDEKVYLSLPTGMENDKVKLLPQLDGKRRKKEDLPAGQAGKEVPDTKPQAEVVKAVSKAN